jgi:hypothetical protein
MHAHPERAQGSTEDGGNLLVVELAAVAQRKQVLLLGRKRPHERT